MSVSGRVSAQTLIAVALKLTAPLFAGFAMAMRSHLGCGVKRLFDEKSFRSYGPFQYDLAQLIAWERKRRPEPLVEPIIPEEQRPAS
jgi:hypothetical protein